MTEHPAVTDHADGVDPNVQRLPPPHAVTDADGFARRANVVGGWALVLLGGAGVAICGLAAGLAPVLARCCYLIGDKPSFTAATAHAGGDNALAALWCFAGTLVGGVLLYRSRPR